MTDTKSRAIHLIKSLLISYGVTLFLLLVISFLMMQTGMSVTAISVSVIITYIIASFTGSFYMGKHVTQKRYLWGLIAALLYFAVYILISLLVNQNVELQLMDYVKTMLIVCCSGMLGGMLS